MHDGPPSSASCQFGARWCDFCTVFCSARRWVGPTGARPAHCWLLVIVGTWHLSTSSTSTSTSNRQTKSAYTAHIIYQHLDNPAPARGTGKKKSTDPPVHLLNPRSTHPPSTVSTIRLFFPLAFFLVRFWSFLGKGSSTTAQKCFYKKSMSKKKSNISTKISMSVFPRLFFVLSRFAGCFSAMGVQKHYKKRFTKQIVSKKFYNKFDQKSKTDFFLGFVFKNTIRGSDWKKKSTKKSDPIPFSYSDPPTHHEGHRFCFCRPLAAGCLAPGGSCCTCTQQAGPQEPVPPMRMKRVSLELTNGRMCL
jgi:hypothetical protein